MNRQYRGSQGQSFDKGDGTIDVESQFIMRLPVEAAGALRTALKSGDGTLVR